MTSDRSRRVRRCSWWGFGAVLAAAAGAGAQQSNSNQPNYQPEMQSNQPSGMSQPQGWQAADYLPQVSNGTVVLCKEENNKTTQVTIQDGRVINAEIDGQYVAPDHVQVQGHKLRVLDENNQVAATLKIPHLSGMAGRSGVYRQYGATDQYDSRFNPPDRYAPDRSSQDRYNDRYYDRQNQPYPPDRYNTYQRDQDRDWDRDRTDWRLREQDRSSRDTYEQDRYGRDQDRYNRQDYYRQDRQDMSSENAPTYQPNRYDNRYDNRPYDSRYNRQGSAYRGGRVYGTTEAGRPAMALGVMTSDATTSDLRTTSGATTYTQGIKVEQVQEGMPGASAGLQKGDVIVAIDGRTPATMTVLHQRIAEKDPGDTVQLRVLRNGTEQTIPVRLERIDYTKYNWDFMGNPTTVDQGRDTVDQDLLQQPNKQEIYRPSQDSSGTGRPAWDRMRDRANPNTNPSGSNYPSSSNPR